MIRKKESIMKVAKMVMSLHTIKDLKRFSVYDRSFKKLDVGFFDLVFMVDIAIVVEDSTTWICGGCGGVDESSSSSFEILIVGIRPLLLSETNIQSSNANGCRQEQKKLAQDHN
uniref:Uncharacterized protein n=1 Tax=Tanacetum cinerariifolium TaxID=118510 RepID=A0A699IJF4_TANCI|nr:hypothetical protein [Tanacetum cinerariifolium]